MSNELVILGGGESGVGAALLAQREGLAVFVSDRGSLKAKHAAELEQAGIAFEQGGHDEARVLSAHEIIKSPGIADSAPLIVKAKAAGISIIDEIEFAGRYTTAKRVCISGTNGKTTTTHLIYHVLRKGGVNVGIAGNMGKSLARTLVSEPPRDVYVIELSSFQLDGLHSFHIDIAVLLNITPDHLDRYGYAFGNYIASKFSMVHNQGANDHFIYNADDEIMTAYMRTAQLPMQCWPVSLSRTLAELENRGAGIENDQLFINTHNTLFTMKIQELALQGKHNLFNSMAAGVTSRIFELRKELVRESLSNFENLEHRLEFVAKVNDITFINDSKATNVNSTWYAIESIDRPTVWIAGGVDKGNDYADLLPLVKAKVKALICLGKDNSKLHEAFGALVPLILNVESAEDAVRAAYEIAHSGDTVILSPACASFDLFENFEDRGHQFKAAVRRL